MRGAAIAAQAREEIRMTLERGESLLVTFGIPIFLLVFFTEVPVLPTGTSRRVDFLAPGVLGLAVMSTAMVSLGIATGFERAYGVLKRLGSTPLGRRALIAAKILAVLAVECAQVVILGAVAFGLGWRPSATLGLGLLAELLATIAFAGLGLLMAGTLRAEVTLAVANGVYVVLLLIGGVVFPLSKLGGLAGAARLLPAAALSDILHPTLGTGGPVPGLAWGVLAAWAVLAPALAALTFRFD